jgi:5-methylcytosine-specific restriction protein A
MPFQPPNLGRQSAPRKKWAPPTHRPDNRKRGRAGQRDRRQVLDEEPFCRLCLAADRSTLSVVVDHIKRLADGGSDERSNKQALCKPCHDAKTASELDLDRRARRDA